MAESGRALRQQDMCPSPHPRGHTLRASLACMTRAGTLLVPPARHPCVANCESSILLQGLMAVSGILVPAPMSVKEEPLSAFKCAACIDKLNSDEGWLIWVVKYSGGGLEVCVAACHSCRQVLTKGQTAAALLLQAQQQWRACTCNSAAADRHHRRHQGHGSPARHEVSLPHINQML